MMRLYESKRERKERVAKIPKQFKREEKWDSLRKWVKHENSISRFKISQFSLLQKFFWLHFHASVERWRARERDYFDIFAVVTFFYFYCANPHAMIQNSKWDIHT